MSFLRICGLLCVLLCSAGGGIYCAGRLTLRVESLESLQGFFSQLERLMVYTAQPVGELFHAMEKQYPNLVFLKDCSVIFSHSGSFSSAFAFSLRQNAFSLGLTKEDVETICKSSGQIGHTDMEGQQAIYQLLRLQISQQLQSAREQAQKKARLYRSVGVLGGIALVLFAL